MSDVVHDTFVITRAYPVPPDRLFRAFADADRKRRWYAEGGHTVAESFELDFREGGVERSVSRLGEDTPFPGAAMVAESVFLDISRGRRIVMSQVMSIAGRRISIALITFEMRAGGDGAALVLTHQAVFLEGSDGPERRRGGWEALLDVLGQSLAA